MLTIEGRGPFVEGIRCRESDNIITVDGSILRIRDMAKFCFIVLRTGRSLIQCVLDHDGAQIEGLSEGRSLMEGDCIRVVGTKVDEPRATGGFEVHVAKLKVLSQADCLPPLNIAKPKLGASLEVILENRPIALRHPRERAIFKLQEGIIRAYRYYLQENGFTEIHSPKTTSAGAEGGANIFKLDYFGQPACLAQSPQIYKQMMVGVFSRVFEVAPVFRAEKHNTTRHLNEYISMDLEMGYIDSMYDVMDTEIGLLKYILEYLNTHFCYELQLLEVKLPVIDKVPVLKFREAKELIVKEYGRRLGGHGDLDPEEEVLLCDYATKHLGSEFIFITHFPSSRRPFYVMDDPEDPGYAFSFDLLFRGLEITTGGQRIHSYTQQVQKMKDMGLDPAEFAAYLSIHKHGMPPHGGLGLGLERLEMQLLGLNNVRHTSLFPRDVKRITP